MRITFPSLLGAKRLSGLLLDFWKTQHFLKPIHLTACTEHSELIRWEACALLEASDFNIVLFLVFLHSRRMAFLSAIVTIAFIFNLGFLHHDLQIMCLCPPPDCLLARQRSPVLVTRPVVSPQSLPSSEWMSHCVLVLVFETPFASL